MQYPSRFLPLGRVLAAAVMLVTPLLTTAGDWPTYLHDTSRSASSPDETTLSTSNAGQLVEHWSYATGGMIAAPPTVVGGTVYVGSWDGYEYALNATTGALEWRTFLGTTGAYPNCNPPSAGVTSGAAVQNGVVYVGGSDYKGGTNTYFYALNASNGNILWTVNTGDGSATGGHYDWASPLIIGNFAYVGIASFGDCPLVQGQLLKVDLTQHTVVASANLVPTGELGGGVWTSPTYDAATNTIYVTTGTKFATDQTMSQAVVALSATDLTIESAWQIPEDQALGDADFGTTPLLATDSSGNRVIVADNKNGYMYAFSQPGSATSAINLAAGPAWEERLDPGGSNPSSGDGTVSSAAFANGTIYQATGNAVVNGSGYGGSVNAINPANGAIEWQHPTAYPIIPAIATANGLIVDAEGPTVEVLNAGTGARLYSYTTGAPLYGPPSVANGQIFIGGTDHNVYAFGLAEQPLAGAARGRKLPHWLDLSGYRLAVSVGLRVWVDRHVGSERGRRWPGRHLRLLQAHFAIGHRRYAGSRQAWLVADWDHERFGRRDRPPGSEPDVAVLCRVSDGFRVTLLIAIPCHSRHGAADPGPADRVSSHLSPNSARRRPVLGRNFCRRLQLRARAGHDGHGCHAVDCTGRTFRRRGIRCQRRRRRRHVQPGFCRRAEQQPCRGFGRHLPERLDLQRHRQSPRRGQPILEWRHLDGPGRRPVHRKSVRPVPFCLAKPDRRRDHHCACEQPDQHELERGSRDHVPPERGGELAVLRAGGYAGQRRHCALPLKRLVQHAWIG